MSAGSEQNEAVVRACFENAAQRNFAAFDDILTTDYVLHPDGVRGAEGLRQMVEGYLSAISDLRVELEHQFSSGDYVATRCKFSGTHDGDLLGTPATGRQISFGGLTVSRCENGRIAEEWELVDLASLLGQIGALPEPAQA